MLNFERWRLVLLGFLLTFFSFSGQTFFISLFADQIRFDFNLSHSDFALIYSSITLLSAIVILWSANLIDKLDLRWFLVLIILGSALTSISISAFSNHSAIGLLFFIVGIFVLRHFGQGLLYMSGSMMLVRYLPENQGKNTSIAGMGYSASEAILPFIFLVALDDLTWRQNWLVSAIMLITFLLLALLLLKGHSARHKQYLKRIQYQHNDIDTNTIKQWTRSEVLKNPKFYLFVCALIVPSMMYTGFIFHQLVLVESKGWNLNYWAELFVLYATISIIFKLGYGICVDRFGAAKIVPFIPIPLAIALLILGSYSSNWVAVVFLAFTAISSAGSITLTTPLWASFYGTKHLGSIKSIGVSAMVLSSAVSPIIIGWGIDTSVTFETMALTASAICLITSSLAVLGYWLYVKN